MMVSIRMVTVWLKPNGHSPGPTVCWLLYTFATNWTNWANPKKWNLSELKWIKMLINQNISAMIAMNAQESRRCQKSSIQRSLGWTNENVYMIIRNSFQPILFRNCSWIIIIIEYCSMNDLHEYHRCTISKHIEKEGCSSKKFQSLTNKAHSVEHSVVYSHTRWHW